MASLASLPQLRAGKPEFSFGVITDIQYANIPDGCSFYGVPRYYRHSLEVLQRAVSSWNKKGGLSFAINFGDIVDGFCPREWSRDAILKVLNGFDAFQGGPVYHMLGNHCLYNLPRNELNDMLKIPSSNGSYYDFSPAAGFRIVVLDGYDISALAWPDGHPHKIQAVSLLENKNPNTDKNSPEGLVEEERRYVMYNGGVGGDQLLWLDKTLQDATACGQNVIVCCHLSLHPASTLPAALLWNYDEVLKVIHSYRCVKACLAGHTHTGGYALDSHGVHHRVLEAVLECPPGTDAFGYIDVFDDRLSLVGTDRMESTEMYFH